MTISIKDMKRNSAAQMEKLKTELTKLNSKSFSSDDDRYWTCQTDKAGNGYAVIRFLPAPPNEDLPWARMFTHGFKGPGGWYIENCLSTIGEYTDDPVNNANSKLWDSGIEDNKKLASERKRKLSYHSNIYVVEDPANPDNEGKVYLFRYGKKIFDKLNDLMNPAFPDEKPIDPFDFWAGANFRLKIRKVEGYANYDKSDFAAPSALFEDDDELDAVWKKQHSLKEIVAPDKFKSVDALKSRLAKVLDDSSADPVTRTAPLRAEEAPSQKETSEAPKREVESKSAPAAASVADDDDEDLAFFKRMAE